jgi:hypothetical protein
MATEFYTVGPYSDWYYVMHEVFSEHGPCALEIAPGTKPHAMNLEPNHTYIVMHQRLSDGGCMLGLLQLPKTTMAMKTDLAAPVILARQCYGCDETLVCPPPLRPYCDDDNHLQCSQNPPPNSACP